MTTDKYYLKEKCIPCISERGKDCPKCKYTGFIRGADVTELINELNFKFKEDNPEIFISILWTLRDLIEVVEE